MNGQATPGSYGHMIMTLAQGLEIAQAKGWISEDEATTEFRSRCKTIVEAKEREKEIDALRDRIEELERED
jgi:hypothetical protein